MNISRRISVKKFSNILLSKFPTTANKFKTISNNMKINYLYHINYIKKIAKSNLFYGKVLFIILEIDQIVILQYNDIKIRGVII